MLPRTRRFVVAVCIVSSQPALYGLHQPHVSDDTAILLDPRAVASYASPPAQGACSYSLSPATATAPAIGASANRVSVTTGTGCGWSAVSNAGWISVVSGASGTGSGTVSYNVGANGTGSQRVGTIAIDDLVFTVTQSATSCSYSLGSTSASVPSTGMSGSFSVVTGTSCAWAAVSSVAWITVIGGATGTGMGTVTYSVATNTTGSTRVGIITVGGITYTVTQAGNSCSYSLGSASASVPSTGASNSFSVVTGTSCTWTAVSNVGWITVTAGATGTGMGTVTYSVAANTTGSQRVGIITVGGITYTVTQAGSSCTYSLGSAGGSVPSTGASSSFSVVTGTSCTWTAVSSVSWITVTGGAAGTGMGTVTYSVAANTTGSQRVGIITVAGSTHTVTQAANSCSYGLGSTTASVPSSATSGSVSVMTGTGCSWSAVSNATWLSVTGGASGTGMGTVTYSVAANPTATPRVGIINVAAATLTVTQAPATPPAAPQNLRIVRTEVNAPLRRLNRSPTAAITLFGP